MAVDLVAEKKAVSHLFLIAGRGVKLVLKMTFVVWEPGPKAMMSEIISSVSVVYWSVNLTLERT